MEFLLVARPFPLQPDISFAIHSFLSGVTSIILAVCSFGAAPFLRRALRVSSLIASMYCIGIFVSMAVGELDYWRTYVGPLVGFIAWPLGWPTLIAISGKRARNKITRMHDEAAEELKAMVEIDV